MKIYIIFKLNSEKMENLDEIHLGSSTQMKSIKPEEIVTSKSKPNNSALSSFKKILNLIT